VELGGPCITYLHRIQTYVAISDNNFLTIYSLRRLVVPANVQLNPLFCYPGDRVHLIVVKARRVRHKSLDHKATVTRNMSCHVRETTHLLFLRRQRKESVENNVDEGKLSFYRNIGKAALLHCNSI